MKKQISIALLGLALTLAAGVAAYAHGAGTIKVQVPFAFTAGEKQMPAGRYTVRRIREDGESTLLIRSEDGRSAAVVITNAGGTPSQRASLSFRQYGEHYFLAEVSVPGTNSVRELPKTGGEKKAEREFVAEAGPDAVAKRVTVVGSSVQ